MSSLENNADIELGFIEKTEIWKLRSKYFPSKVGGFPAWLALEDLPKNEELLCEVCSKPLIFLCQIYAPITEKKDCFHRSLFIFICRNGGCNTENNSNNICVFRNQLPRENKYFSYEAPKEIESESFSPSASDYCKICRICGVPGPKVCGGCRMANYCSKEHQAADWKGRHKEECKKKDSLPVDMKIGEILFPEYEIDLEPEEIEKEKEKSEEELLTEYEDLLRKGQTNSYAPEDEDDLIKMAARETDKQFAVFRTRISHYPDQIIRFNRGGEPLWVSKDNKPVEIPPCSTCGQPREFEFQIMPQLLVYLKVDSVFENSIDWGTILIYCCKENCSTGKIYKKEFIFKQDYSPVRALKDKL